MIGRLIGGFVTILIGVSLLGPISTEIQTASAAGSGLVNSSTWSVTVLRLTPGFYALGLLGVAIGVTYGSLRDAGVV